MTRWRFAWAWTIGAVLVLGLPGCGGIDLPDSDGDGIPDIIDPCPTNPDPTCVPPPEPVEAYDCENPPELGGQLVLVSEPVPGELLVMLKPARGVSARADAAAALVARLPQLRGAEVFRQVGALAVKGDASLVRALLADASVAYVQQVGRKHATVEWNLDRIDQRGKSLDGVFEPEGAGAGVNLAVVDTGVTDHPDFTGRLSAECFTTHTFGGCSDQHGHGTHVAGTTTGATFGLARAATLYAVRVLDQNGSGTDTDVIRGIEWVIEKKLARPTAPWVINMSLGGPPAPTLDAAVCRAIETGVVNVIAAGNEEASAYTSSPARVKQAITVGAMGQGDAIAYFSNDGPGLDLWAPGVAIRSAQPGGGSKLMNGTSMASPHVAGAVALELGAYPDATPAEVRDAIVGRATPDALSGVRNGSPNLLLFVGKGEAPPVDMLLRRDGARFVLHSTGKEWVLKGSIRCCAPDDPDEPTAYNGWPLVSIEYVDYVADSGMNAVHLRPGPFLTANEAETIGLHSVDPQWATEIGGPYVEVNGKADLTKWNPRFWDELDRIARHARARAVWMEIGVGFGGWRAERGRRPETDPGFVPHAWHSKWNIQGEDHISNTVSPTMNDSVHRAWSDKLIHALGRYDHILWFNGNEWTKGIHPDRTEALRQFVLERENAYGYAVHIFGTNGGPDTWQGLSDYIEDHTKGDPLLAPHAGKPTAVNEYNPRTPLTANQLFANWCKAHRNGTSYWAWRHMMSAAEFDGALKLIAAGECGAPPPSACKLGTPTAREMAAAGKHVEFVVKREGTKNISVNAKGCFGVEYYCSEEMDWPEACAEQKQCGPVAPPGHPQRLACEQRLFEACGPTMSGRCTGSGDQCPITFDPFYMINGQNQNHPRNVEAGCGGQFTDHESWEKTEIDGRLYITKGAFWISIASGKGFLVASNADGSVNTESAFEIDH